MKLEGRRGVAIITAMGIEGLGLAQALEAGPWDRRLRRGWHEGLLGGCPVVLTTCGIGMKAARHWTRVLLEEYEPRLVILTGVSGGISPYVDVGDLVLAESIYHLGGKQVMARYQADEELLEIAHEVAAEAPLRPIHARQPRVVQAGVATADRVVASRPWGDHLAVEYGVLAAEMEGAAVARVCQEQGVPFLAVRAISDIIGRRWQLLAMVWNLVPVQRNAERLVFALVQHLSRMESFLGG